MIAETPLSAQLRKGAVQQSYVFPRRKSADIQEVWAIPRWGPPFTVNPKLGVIYSWIGDRDFISWNTEV